MNFDFYNLIFSIISLKCSLLILFLIECIICDENIYCYNQLDYLLSTKLLVRFDLIVSINEEKIIGQELHLLHEKISTFNKKLSGISTTTTTTMLNIKTLMNSKNLINNNNNGPILIIFLCLNESEVVNTLSMIVDFHQNDKRGIYWKPIFVIINPIQQSSEIIIKDNPKILYFLAKLSLQSSVYILYTFRLNETNSSNSPYEVLIQEIYSIRDSIIKYEIQVELKFDYLNYFMYNTRRRSNFRKSNVKAIAMDEANYPLSTKFRPDSLEIISGFEVDMFNYFKDSLNFSYQVIKGIGWVRSGPNETLIGYAIQLNKEEGDIAIPTGEFLEQRFKGPEGITFLHPTFHAHVTAFFKQPPPSSIRNVFIQAFTMELWICILIIWIMIIIILKISVFLRRGKYFSNKKDNLISRDSLIWAVGAISQQGWYMSPSSPCIKITFICGIFTGLITYVAYSAALVSMLSVEVVPIRQFIDLLTERFYLTSDLRIPTAIVFIKNLEETNKISNLNGDRNVEISESLEAIINTRFALVTIPDSFYPVIRQNYSDEIICSTVATKVVSSRPLKSSCFVKRGSPLREFFNYKLLVMQERGIKYRMMKHYVMGTSLQCLESTGSFQINFGLPDLFTPFFILLIGISLSLIIVFLEKFYFVNPVREMGTRNLWKTLQKYVI